jgi:hypothetical protein
VAARSWELGGREESERAQERERRASERAQERERSEWEWIG